MSQILSKSIKAGKKHLIVTFPSGKVRTIINPIENFESLHTNYLILNGLGYKAFIQNLTEEEKRSYPKAENKLLVYLGKKEPLKVFTPQTVKITVWKGGFIIQGQSQSYRELQQFLSKVRDWSNDYKNLSATSGIIMADLWKAKFEGDNTSNQKTE